MCEFLRAVVVAFHAWFVAPYPLLGLLVGRYAREELPRGEVITGLVQYEEIAKVLPIEEQLSDRPHREACSM